MTKIGTINTLRKDLKATLKDSYEGPNLTLERISSPETKLKISLKADEWQELFDWVHTITLLH